MIDDRFSWEKLLSSSTMTDKVNQKVRNYLDNHLFAAIRNHLDTNLSKFIKKELPYILDNTSKMQDLFNEHENRLKLELDLTVRKLLKDITNEEEYHRVNQAYFNNVTERVNRMIAQQEKNYQRSN